MTEIDINRSVALLLIRVITGILFFFQAYDKIFKMGTKNVADTFRYSLSSRFINENVFNIGVKISSYIELIGGIVLVLGLFRNYALYILGADLIFVALFFSMMRPMWDMQYYFPRLVLIVVILLCPPEWDRFTIMRFY